MVDGGGPINRRAFLGAAGLALASLTGCTQGQSLDPSRDEHTPTSPVPTKPLGPPIDYASSEAFDWADNHYLSNTDAIPATNDSGGLAWGTAYVLQAYLTMFRVSGDTRYLDRFVKAGYSVLESRDTERHLPDHLDREHPVWAAESSYTACWRDVADTSGNPLIRLRALVRGSQVMADVRLGSSASWFEVSIDPGPDGVQEEFRHLSLDPASPRYVVSWLNSVSPTQTELTAIDLRSGFDPLAVIRTDRGPMSRYRYAFGVHTGMIAAPLAGFAATVGPNRELVRQFGGPAEDFLEAARAAVEAHDPEWTTYDERIGVYTYPRGAPVRGDGTPLPHNQYLALARAHLNLSQCLEDPVHAARAGAMLEVFMSDLSPGAAPVWPYYWSKSSPFRGYGQTGGISSYSPSMAPSQALEDTAHGALDIECVVLGRSLGVGPSDAEMTRLGSTFVRRVVATSASGKLTSRNSLDASSGLSRYDLSAPRWVGLSPWQPGVFQAARTLFNQLAPMNPGAETLASIAALVAHR